MINVTFIAYIKVLLTPAFKWQIRLNCYLLSHFSDHLFILPKSVKLYIQQKIQNDFLFLLLIGILGPCMS